ncbi:T9SS type A sorting domain-containing protein [Flavobacterium sp.]|uniref:T9SS type A sorting domain-containing protein n=1 Tax=Flavobacterium sp. TaxID=239 RepID=UPI0033421294
MKKLVLFIIGVTFQISSAQIINFPDLNFKNALLDLPINYDSNGTIFPMIDLNNDDEITQAEAQLVQKLNLSYAELNDLTGLQFFINLRSFDSLFFNGSSFNFPGLINLENLTLSNAVTGQSNLVTINLSSNINLKTVSCYTNANTINLSNLTQLTNLTLYGNFTSLNINDSENLLFLNISAPLNSLNLSNNTKLININLAGTTFSNLDLSACLNLEIIEVSNGEMQTLNLGNLKHVRYLFVPNNRLTSLNANNFFNLEFINCQNNLLTNLFLENGTIEQSIDFSGNPNLASICCDANEIVYIQNDCNILGYNSTVSNCTSSARQISMFPNPVKNQLHLSAGENIEKVEFFTSHGLLIMTSTDANNPIDMENIPSGMYFIKVYVANDVTEMKVIKL